MHLGQVPLDGGFELERFGALTAPPQESVEGDRKPLAMVLRQNDALELNEAGDPGLDLVLTALITGVY